MDTSDAHVASAAAYLRDNSRLRAAVGARPEARLVPHYLGEGEHNLNYWFADPDSGRKFVLRVNVVPQPFHENQVSYEHAALVALADCGRCPSPLYLDDSPSAPGKGALIISYCEGDELDFDHLREGDLQCAAQIMADVHAVEVSESTPLYRPADPLRAMFEECLQRFAMYRASAFEDARITAWAERFVAQAQEALDSTIPPQGRLHLVNTETLPSHFLIPRSAAQQAARALTGTGRFCEDPGSFVDWERPLLGEVAQDVAYFVSPTTTFWDSEYLMPSNEAFAFVEDYWRAVDGRFERGRFDERFSAYRKMTALRSVTWCCRALITYAGDAGGHTTDKTACKLPVFLSDDFMQSLADECF